MLGYSDLGMDAATIAWLPGSIEPAGRGISDSLAADPLVETGMSGGLFAKRPRFPSWRCRTCKIVEFAYGEGASRP